MRRIVVVGLVGGVVVVTAIAVSRRRAVPQLIAGEPQWEPLRLVEPEAQDRSGYEFGDAVPDPVPRTAEVEPAVGPAEKWVVPDEQGGCPGTHPVKGKRSSRIFHVPGGAFYAQTKADRCFCDEEAAEADGYRRAKR
jgi:hypothetical protein